MEQSERDLIRELSLSNIMLRRLYDEHIELEDKVTLLENRNFLTSQEEIELRELKKKKLLGVDKMMHIIHVHRTGAAV